VVSVHALYIVSLAEEISAGFVLLSSFFLMIHVPEPYTRSKTATAKTFVLLLQLFIFT
jgi:hypothetical protein